ncbi:MAG: hypothetical protein WB762_26520 [Candidatus Sulfotelmatobacter sp.]
MEVLFPWRQSQADIFRETAEFQAQGGKLVRLEFPRNKIRRYGDNAFVYSELFLDTEVGGKRSLTTSRAMEGFVFRDGHWINPGWHTDSHKQQQ